MNVRIAEDWKEILKDEFEKDYFARLVNFVKEEYTSKTVYPKGGDIFRAFNKCPFCNLRVVIIGQDPYHEENQANGLSFSVNDGVKFPPSLQNIFKEIASDLNIAEPSSGNLDRWAEQGVLLLNSVLTVRAHEAASHTGRGWETFTDAVVREIAKRKKNVVYILWGSYAQKKCSFVSSEHNLIIKSVHPSPLSVYRGFFGSKPFSKTNEYLSSMGLKPIEW